MAAVPVAMKRATRLQTGQHAGEHAAATGWFTYDAFGMVLRLPPTCQRSFLRMPIVDSQSGRHSAACNHQTPLEVVP